MEEGLIAGRTRKTGKQAAGFGMGAGIVVQLPLWKFPLHYHYH